MDDEKRPRPEPSRPNRPRPSERGKPYTIGSYQAVEQATANPGERRDLGYEVRVIRPGDKIIIELDGHPSPELIEMVREKVGERFADHDVLYIAGGRVIVEPA